MHREPQTSPADVLSSAIPLSSSPTGPSELTATLATLLLCLRRTTRARTATVRAAAAPAATRFVQLLRAALSGAPRAIRGFATSVLTTRAADARAASGRRFQALRSSLVPAFGPQATAAALLVIATAVLTSAGVAAASLMPGVQADVLGRSAAPAVGTAGPAGGGYMSPGKASAPSAPVDPAIVSDVAAAASSAPVEVVLDPVLPTDRGALPLGKGMWLWLPDRVEGGNVDALVARSQQIGLTHLYVRTGSSKGGFYAGPYLDELLPKAHAAGIRIYGWDFPYLQDVAADVGRAAAAIHHTTPTGHRIDGFAADIETPSEGTHLTVEGVAAYGGGLRAAVGAAYPLIAVVPRPSALMLTRFPYTEATAAFDAIAPMTYWLNRQPDSDVTHDVAVLSPLGKPIIPIGQAYDGAPEGGRPGPPPPDEIARFLAAAEASGAVGA
ncbi:MAG: hypothetical protein WD232_08630, partial [Acidimicrobiales bacterium]